MKKGLIIAIDGPSGAGKSTVSRLIARRLGYIYVDTGAMYRAIAWKAKEKGVDAEDEASLENICEISDIEIRLIDGEERIYIDGMDVSINIRMPEIGMLASKVSAFPCVRKKLSELQRKFGKAGGVVLEGRDIGTVIFPDADIKFFLNASVEERSRRRHSELKAKGLNINIEDTIEDIRKRDYNDTKRDIAPLRIAEDAIVIDSTSLDIEGVLNKMINEIAKKQNKMKGFESVGAR